MSTRVRVLSPGFTSPNSRTFLFPLVRHADDLAAAGVELEIGTSWSGEPLDAEQVWVDSKCLSPTYAQRFPELRDRLPDVRRDGQRLLFFDTQDSTGSLETQVLGHVDAYYKAQLLRDLARYEQPYYGLRVHTDYYHSRFGVDDDRPEWSRPVPSEHLGKLGASWNSGLTDFSLFAYTRRRLHIATGRRWFVRQPAHLARPRSRRPVDVACRMSVDYDRDTVSFQRREVADVLRKGCPGRKLPRALYLAEMRMSKVVASPFGWGEINYRDFEAIRAGALLFKPDMGHLRTYPDWYEAGTTYLAHSWHLDDVGARLGEALSSPRDRIGIASEAQRRYRHHVLSPAGAADFVERVVCIAAAATDGRVIAD